MNLIESHQKYFTPLSFSLPMNMETQYGVTVINRNNKNLKTIENEAARIITCPTNQFQSRLYIMKQVGNLETRTYKHKLVLFYQTQSKLSPLYPSSMVLPAVDRFLLDIIKEIPMTSGWSKPELIFLPIFSSLCSQRLEQFRRRRQKFCLS